MKTNDTFVRERENEILKILDDKRRATVPELAAIFDVSESTIRRHLNALGKRGELFRTHGGALSLSEATFEDTLDNKRNRNIELKKSIAREARSQISDGDTVILGGGTTVLELARLLLDLRNSTVLTNNVLAAAELYSNSNIDVCICGGTIRDRTGVVIGPEAIRFFSSLGADKAFVGADSISLEYGITTPNSFEAQIEYLLMQRATISYVLADHSKMNKISISHQCSLDEIDFLITDTGIDEAFLRSIEEVGPQLLLCSG